MQLELIFSNSISFDISAISYPVKGESEGYTVRCKKKDFPISNYLLEQTEFYYAQKQARDKLADEKNREFDYICLIDITNVDFRAISYEDNAQMSALLAAQTDPVMESLANSIINDPVITANNSFVWVTNGMEIHALNQRMHAQRSLGADFLRTNNINIISVFTFVSTGPTGHGLQPTR